MALELGGLHHMTAITARAAENVAFYTKTLGLRLVKKTVNQDDLSAYHFFYADKLGSAGTDITFFDWANTPPNQPGAGEVAVTGLRVAQPSSLNWWATRFDDLGVNHGTIGERGGQPSLSFTDHEGQRLELVADGDRVGAAPGTPWELSPVPPEHQILGLASFTLMVNHLAATAALLTDILGFREVHRQELPQGGLLATFETGPGGPGTLVRVAAHPGLPGAAQGYGGVHHVAFRVPDFEQHAAWQRQIASAGLAVTPVIDRYYFRSIYFREPGGVLYELATDGPGFAGDEHPDHLGEKLALPPFLERHRARIEAGLKPI